MAPNVLFLFFRNQEMREITNHLRKAGIKLNHLNAMKSRNTDGIQTKYKKETAEQCKIVLLQNLVVSIYQF